MPQTYKIDKIIKSRKTTTDMGMMKSPQKFQN